MKNIELNALRVRIAAELERAISLQTVWSGMSTRLTDLQEEVKQLNATATRLITDFAACAERITTLEAPKTERAYEKTAIYQRARRMREGASKV